MNQASKFIPCCFFHFLMCSRIIKYISFIPNFAVPFLRLMNIMINDRYRNSPFITLKIKHKTLSSQLRFPL